MFSKAKPKSYKAAASIAPTILSTDLAITGDLVSEGEVQIDGKVNGDIRCTMLTIGVSGCLTGQVFADYALIRGRVDGRIRAHNVTLARTARVVGDIIHESLMIEPGAYIEGRCERLDAVTIEPDKRLNLVVSETPNRSG